MTKTKIELLESGLDTTQRVIAGVVAKQADLPTPCPDFTVDQVVDHLVGWANSFAARLGGGEFDGDPNTFRAGPDPADEYATAARQMIAAYRDGSDTAQELQPGMILVETLVHGWDLAVATGQDASFDPAVADLALATARAMLKPEYRGEGKFFGAEVPIPEDASTADRLVAFAGRDPRWQPSAA